MRGAELVFSETSYWSLYQTSPCIASTLIFLPGDCFPCPVRELWFSHSSLDFTSLYLRTLLFLRCPKLKNCPPAREYTYILSLSTKHIYGYISYVYAHITYQWFSINSYGKYGWLKKNNTLFILFFFFFFFFIFWLCQVACRILVPQPRKKPASASLEEQNLKHWTTREVSAYPLVWVSVLDT